MRRDVRRAQFGVAIKPLRCSGFGRDLPQESPVVRYPDYRPGLVTFCPHRAMGEHNTLYREDGNVHWFPRRPSSEFLWALGLWEEDGVV